MHDLKAGFPHIRPRRARLHPQIRRLVRETTLTAADFIYPLFVHHGQGVKQAITTMPGCYQYSIDTLQQEIEEIVALNIPGIMLFGIPEHKDAVGSSALNQNSVVAEAARAIKTWAPDLLITADLCFCEYTSHGHCGVIDANKQLDNDKTLPLLAEQALVLAEAGVDVMVPSGMLDGKVAAVRAALDGAGFTQVSILSHSMKYCSSLYGAFREAVNSSPQFGDRSTYQADPANQQEAIKEVSLDIAEGADFIMVKPAVSYLDVITTLKQRFPQVPLAAYHVSVEYAMIKAASEKGFCDERAVALEQHLAIKRAGASFIVSYYAKDCARWLTEANN